MLEASGQFARAVVALIKLEAMKAENQKRSAEGHAQAYGEQEMMELVNEVE